MRFVGHNLQPSIGPPVNHAIFSPTRYNAIKVFSSGLDPSIPRTTPAVFPLRSRSRATCMITRRSDWYTWSGRSTRAINPSLTRSYLLTVVPAIVSRERGWRLVTATHTAAISMSNSIRTRIILTSPMCWPVCLPISAKPACSVSWGDDVIMNGPTSAKRTPS